MAPSSQALPEVAERLCRLLFQRIAIPPASARPVIAIVLGSGTTWSVYVAGTAVIDGISTKPASSAAGGFGAKEIEYVPSTTSTPAVSSVNVAIVVGVAVIVTGVLLNVA